MENWKTEALRFFCLGLTSKEISPIVGVSYRTIQRAISEGKWKEIRRARREEQEKRATRKILKTLKKAEK